MANTTVSLHVKKADKSPGKKWQISSRKGFYYKFTGGNTKADDGTISFKVGKGPKTIEIRLSDSTRRHFEITNAGFTTTEGLQGQITPIDTGDKKYDVRRKFKDFDTKAAGGCFGVTVEYTKTKPPTGHIVCDPAWRNRS